MAGPRTMPTLVAAIESRSGIALIAPYCTSLPSARASATHAPVMDAVLVPPSACRTSQSSMTVRSPSAVVSTTDRMDRPISRWIS